MFVVTRSRGNIHTDEELALEVQRRAKVDEVVSVNLPFHDAGRRRLRVTSDTGLMVGINLEKGNELRDGDVLVAGEDESTLVLVHVAPSEAMSLRLTEELRKEDAFAFGVRLGHMLGNQHWPIVVTSDRILAPVSIDRKVMETVVRTHGFEGIEWDFVPVQPGEVPAGMPDVQHQHAHD